MKDRGARDVASWHVFDRESNSETDAQVAKLPILLHVHEVHGVIRVRASAGFCSIMIPDRSSVRIEDIIVIEDGGGKDLNSHPPDLVVPGYVTRIRQRRPQLREQVAQAPVDANRRPVDVPAFR